MTRRCSHCSHNGHNSRTCPNRGVKLFGVRLTDGSIRKSASMGNLSHYAGSASGTHNGNGSNNPGSPGEGPDHGDGYASEDFVPGSSSSRERKKGFNFIVFPLGVNFVRWFWILSFGISFCCSIKFFRVNFFFGGCCVEVWFESLVLEDATGYSCW